MLGHRSCIDTVLDANWTITEPEPLAHDPDDFCWMGFSMLLLGILELAR